MLADRFTLSDNFHQSFHGGTGANHFMLGHRRCCILERRQGNAVTPPANLIATRIGGRHRQPLHGRRHTGATARTSSSPASSRSSAYLENLPYAGRAELQSPSLLHAQQRQSGLPAERCEARCSPESQ